jgi:large subunit ribosomal protein L33
VGERQRVALVCEECGARNYKKTKALRASQGPGQPERLALKKYCPHCKRHTVHRESK